MALWRQSPQAIKENDYDDFYRQLTLDFEPPLRHVHLVVDVPVHLRSILYLPRRRERGILHLQTEHGLRLYSRNVLIQEHCRDLLPEYLSLVAGVVDSEDIPLNISRETVQSNRVMRQIRKALTSRVLRELADLADENVDDYRLFWDQFGVFLKQGTTADALHRGDLLPLLRFHSSKSGDELISLADYVARMPSDQDAIYYILASDRGSASRSPHLDYFAAHDIEVLFLLDPLDGLLPQAIGAYEEKPMRNVDDPDLDLTMEEKDDEESEEAGGPGIAEDDFEQVVERFSQVLGERVAQVRESRLLADHACRLVSPERGPEWDLQRVRRMLGEDAEAPPRILEINRRHPLIRNLASLVNTPSGADVADPVIEQLFEDLLLLEGLHPNPAHMVPRIEALLEAATRSARSDERP
jgi:molecular chaperone HtpG